MGNSAPSRVRTIAIFESYFYPINLPPTSTSGPFPNIFINILPSASAWLRAIRHWRCLTGHATLPQKPSLWPIRELSGNAVQYASVMEYHQVAFAPSMSIDVLWLVDLALQPVTDPSNLCEIIDHGSLAIRWIFGTKRQDIATKNLQVWLLCLSICPYHLERNVSTATSNKL